MASSTDIAATLEPCSGTEVEADEYCPKCDSGNTYYTAAPNETTFRAVCYSCGHLWGDRGVTNSYRVALADRLLKYSFVEAIGGMPSADWKDFQALMQQALRGQCGPSSREMRMEIALRKIAKWFGEFPRSGHHFPTTHNGEKVEMSYGAAFGSNGERDFMRKIASDALDATGERSS